ncbi:hypothetical protein WDU94_005533 [Cyamophila willieti]
MLLMIYKSLIRSKLDYGSLVYNSATSRTLQILNPVQNLCLRLATGAFRSTPIKSLEAETGEPSLDIRRKMLTRNYIVKVLSIDKHPNYYKICNPSYVLKYELSDFKPTIGIQKQILDPSIPFGSIMKCHYQDEPWLNKFPMCDISLSYFKKESVSGQFFKIEFNKKMNDGFQNHTKVYTDGSKDENGVGCAFTIPDRNIVKKYSLNKDASIFHAELYAILQSLIMIIDMSMEKAIIITDSLSCLQALVQLGHPNPLVQKIQSLFTSYQAEIKFFWCPSHVGIAGNESADKLAKEAINMNNIAHSELFVDEIKVIIKKSLFEDWNHSWFNTSPHDNKLRAIKNSVSKWKTSFQKSRLDEVCLMRLRVGHCNFTHVYLFKKEDKPMCCNEPVTVEHILMKCPRLRFRPSNFPLSSVPEILKNDPDSVNVVMRFLKKNNFMRMI